jgi:type I restriction enzyme S subunit
MAGQAITRLTLQKIGKFKILLPPLPEQKAIADLLTTWDEAIEKTERLIVKKQKFYEVQLSKRLSSDVSERIQLKKFLKEVSKRNRDISITQVLSVTNSKGFVRPEDQFDRQVASDNLSNYKIVSMGEYAYNPSRINVGSIARLDGWDVGVLSPMYTVFEIKKPSELHTDLFLHWLNSHEAKQRIKLSAQGSVRETVSFDDLCAIGFPKIDFNEQKVLAEYFSLISAEIDSLKALSDKYKAQKRGLMQKMLTGEWRVKPEVVKRHV